VGRVEVTAANRVGIVSDVTGAIAQRGLRLAGIVSRQSTTDTDDTVAKIELGIEVTDLFELADVIRRLRRIPGVVMVRRLSGLID
jgi:GTP pyrophosphokinase